MSLATRTSATTTSCVPTRWGTSGGLGGGGGWLGGSPVPGAGLQQDPGEGEGSTAPKLGLAPCSAFNNILSNLGYVLLGLLFLLIILQREINYNRALLRNDTHALVRDRAAWGGSGCLEGAQPPGTPTLPLPRSPLPHRSVASPSTLGSSMPWAPPS